MADRGSSEVLDYRASAAHGFDLHAPRSSRYRLAQLGLWLAVFTCPLSVGFAYAILLHSFELRVFPGARAVLDSNPELALCGPPLCATALNVVLWSFFRRAGSHAGVTHVCELALGLSLISTVIGLLVGRIGNLSGWLF